MSVKDVVLGWGFYRFKRKRERDAAAQKGTPAEKPAAEAHAKQPRAPGSVTHAAHARGFKGVLTLVKDAASEWSNDKAPRLGAALSYYTVFAIAPVLLLAISVAGLVFGREAAQGQILDELGGLLGPDTAKMVQEMLANSAKTSSGVMGTIIGAVTLAFGATAVMIELEAALDTVWKVKPRPGRGIMGVIKERILSLGLVLSLGFLLLVSLVASAMLSAMGGLLEAWSFPGANILGQVLANVVTLGVIAAFFALVYRYLPNTDIAWKDVWVGALVTSVLFHVGKILIGVYLGRATVASTFGAAGSLAILLVWVYYTAQIVLFGAEVTRIYAQRYGSGIHPDEDAVPAPQAAECATGGTKPAPQHG